MILRPAKMADLAAMADIQTQSPGASQWDPHGYLAYVCVLAEEDGVVLGFIVCRRVAPEESEILNLAVRPSARRRGVARRLVQTQIMQEPGAWFLEVRESNSDAIQFYEKLGFEQAGRRPEYYSSPNEAALVMKFNS